MRRAGQGGDIPKPNRIERLNRKLRARTHSLSSTASAPSDDDDEEEEDDDDHSGFAGLDARMLESQIGGGFKWGVARMSWGPGGQNGGVGVPEASENDFARNFEDEEDEEDDEEYLSTEEGDADDGPLVPGIYRSLYAFDPEGTAEMALVEDQHVTVVGSVA